MQHLIRNLRVQNFKTAKNINIDCKRINIIIGKPNVGKSNILEAISLLAASYSIRDSQFLSDFVRYKQFEDLFYDKETANPIEVATDIGCVHMRHVYRQNQFELFFGSGLKQLKSFIASKKPLEAISNFVSNKPNPAPVNNETIAPMYLLLDQSGKKIQYTSIGWNSPVKKYEFVKDSAIDNRFHYFLVPPFGNNLYSVVNTNKKLFKEIATFFKEYKLKFVLKSNETKFEIQKEVDGVVYSYDYNLIADTLQRFIFNLMAIESNKNSVLLFEEPEAHLFPPYAKKFAEKVIASETNQFFITSHSPFILNTIIENCKLSEVAVFIASYDRFQTKLKALTDKELEQMLSFGNDIFFSEKLNG